MKDNQTVTIRQVEQADLPALRMFFQQNDRPEVTAHFHPFPLNERSAAQIAAGTGQDGYYLAQQGEMIVGLCMLRGWDEGYDVPSFGVMIDHRHHGRGIGRALTAFAINEARRRGSPRVRLTVYASNDRAARLYESLGFRAIKREPVMRAGEPDERITMTRELAA